MKIRNGYYMTPDGFLIHLEKDSTGWYWYENRIGRFHVWEERVKEILTDSDFQYLDFIK